MVSRTLSQTSEKFSPKYTFRTWGSLASCSGMPEAKILPPSISNFFSNRQRLAYVVIGNEYSDPAGLQIADDLLQIEDCDRVDTGKRFIEQNKSRVDAQGAGNFNAPPVLRQTKRIPRFFLPDEEPYPTDRSTLPFFARRSCQEMGWASSTARMFSSTVSLRKTEAS